MERNRYLDLLRPVAIGSVGFAAGGHLSGPALADCTVGLAATLLSGRDPAASAHPQALIPYQPHRAPKAA